jgi:hypothetical protein
MAKVDTNGKLPIREICPWQRSAAQEDISAIDCTVTLNLMWQYASGVTQYFTTGAGTSRPEMWVALWARPVISTYMRQRTDEERHKINYSAHSNWKVVWYLYYWRRPLKFTGGTISFIQIEYLVATVQGQLRSGRAGPFVKVEGCCD